MNNVYLIGMPGSGKSALGKTAAKELNKGFIDLDDLVEKKAGKTISEIFKDEGESSFRSQEKAALKDVSECSGLLIATGGGIILDPDNVFRMKESGTVIFIDRPLETLLKYTDTGKRPLLKKGRQELINLYQKRYDLYLNSADMIVENNASFKNILTKIIECINNN